MIISFFCNTKSAKEVITIKRKRKKTDLNFTAFENITEKQVYLIGDAGFILGHIIYLIMFAFLGVNFMVGYNCFSILFYIVL